MEEFYVYIVTNRRNGTLYLGCTNDIKRRIFEHKNKILKGFTEKYNTNKLVYYQSFISKDEAFTKERQMKTWKRKWKVELIEQNNPNWIDLSEDWFEK